MVIKAVHLHYETCLSSAHLLCHSLHMCTVCLRSGKSRKAATSFVSITASLTPTPNSLPSRHTDWGCCCPRCHHVLTFAALACHALIKCYLMALRGPKQANTPIRSVCLVKEMPLCPPPSHPQHPSTHLGFFSLLSVNTCDGLRET